MCYTIPRAVRLTSADFAVFTEFSEASGCNTSTGRTPPAWKAKRQPMLSQFKVTSLIGPVACVALWLGFMPIVADVSERLAVVGLMVVTALYAPERPCRGVLGGFGAIAAFVELGLIPVVLVSVLAARAREVTVSGGK